MERLLERHVHPAVVAITLAILTMVLVAGKARVEAGQGQGGTAAPAGQGVECPEGDLVYRSLREFLPGSQRARSSSAARDELARQFRATYPRGNADRFSRAYESDEEAEFLLKGDDGKILASAYLTRDQAGWKLRSFAACNSFLLTVIDPAKGEG